MHVNAKALLIAGAIAMAGCSAMPAAAPARGSGRTLIWEDNFAGPAGGRPDPHKWRAVTGPYGSDTHELEWYTARSSNVALDGAGHLVITARRETHTGNGVTRRYTSARLETAGLFQTMYGELDARIKIPAGQGLWPAFWGLGSDYPRVGWPRSGELDMMEALGNDPFTVYGTIHGPSSDSPAGWSVTMHTRHRVSLAAGYHVYGARWSPDKVVFTLDGVPYAQRKRTSLKAANHWVLNKPFYLILNLAVGGDWPGSPNASTPFPARMLVDWVKVYS